MNKAREGTIDLDINSILSGIDCNCGKTHKCDIKYVFVENGAISKLSQLCEQKSKILIVADENTFEAAGEKVVQVLGDKVVAKVVFGGNSILVPNENAVEKVQEHLGGIDLIIGVGSGVIQDLCKYVSFHNGIQYIVVATAPSMDGYASSGAAMILKGMKETVSAGLPTAIIADVDVLKNAPLEMIKAGYGDIIGKYSALNDWKLGHLINDEYFCQYIYDTTYKMIERTLSTAEGLLKRDDISVKTLMEALIIVGIMMSFAGSSRPASGSEHHLSHFFEIVGLMNGEPYFVHGIDVAYSTVITSQIREKILKSEFPDTIYRLPEVDYTKKMQQIYKSIADGCIELQQKNGNYSTDRIGVYRSMETEIKAILAEVPSTKEIENMLHLAEIDMKAFYDTYNVSKIQDAIMYAKDLKDRYTVLWCYYDMFGGC